VCQSYTDRTLWVPTKFEVKGKFPSNIYIYILSFNEGWLEEDFQGLYRLDICSIFNNEQMRSSQLVIGDDDPGF
jgi:hypothetical protein